MVLPKIYSQSSPACKRHPSNLKSLSVSRPSGIIRLVDGNSQWSMVSSASGNGTGPCDLGFVYNNVSTEGSKLIRNTKVMLCIYKRHLLAPNGYYPMIMHSPKNSSIPKLDYILTHLTA